MARKTKEPLILNGVEVRDLETLRENFNVKVLADYALDGRLIKFLRERYYEVEAEKVEALQQGDSDLESKLYAIFEVEDPEIISWRNERLERLKNFTADEKILAKVDSVAFNQEDLGDLLDEGVAEIFLCDNHFRIPLKVQKKYIGVGNAVAVIRSDTPVDFDALNISFENISFNPEYAEIAPQLKQSKTSDEFFQRGMAEFDAKNFPAAIEFFEQAAALDNFLAMFMLGKIYYEKMHRPHAAFEWYLKAAEAGYVDAMCIVAKMYKTGEGVRENEPHFNRPNFDFFDGIPPILRIVMGNSGELEKRRIEAERQESEYRQKIEAIRREDNLNAFHWYLKAAELGNVDAMVDVAKIYSSTDKQKALEWYREAAKRGSRDAQVYLEATGIEIHGNTARVKTSIKNRCGIHTGPARCVVQTASKFKSKIRIAAKGKKIDAKSILMIMTLSLTQGTEIEISAEGADAAEAVKTLLELINSRFGEV